MKQILFLMCFVTACGQFAYSQSHMPSNFFMKTLDNGLQVLVIEDNSVPLATIEIAVHNGAFTEDSNFNGLSHLYEHMFFKANKDIPSQEAYLQRVHELGIVFNGTTNDERVNYFFTLPVANVDAGLHFMNSAIRYPLFLKEEMKKENPVVDGEFQRGESNPTFGLFQDWNKAMWGNLATRKNAIGIHDVILSATPEKMHTIQNRYYYPNNSLLTVAGAVKHEEVFAKVQAIMGDWKASSFDIFKTYPVPEFTPLTENKTFVTTSPNARIPMVMMGWFGPDTRNDVKSTYTADVFSFILSQASSKFQQQLVDSGLAYQVQFNYQTAKYVGPIILFIVPNPARLKDCMNKVKELINEFDDPSFITDDQLQTAKDQLTISNIYDSENTSQYVHTISFWWASATIDYYNTYLENIKKVTRADIAAYVDKYIKGKPMAAGILLSPAMKQQMGITDFNQLYQ